MSLPRSTPHRYFFRLSLSLLAGCFAIPCRSISRFLLYVKRSPFTRASSSPALRDPAWRGAQLLEPIIFRPKSGAAEKQAFVIVVRHCEADISQRKTPKSILSSCSGTAGEVINTSAISRKVFQLGTRR
ncbi:hypothetical protein QBC46DRAFT_380682 [Diplogelasinospora grovesii]|uniref:Uncharacterized protein n=1 Tax=Diplogelasinospora grovesii TaxID=303347 RepID=A0AAN6S5Q5_9PEZI|nr:hypothetical protein QBC46DRAFT_380682 [Diplogelasinospora grovesii]